VSKKAEVTNAHTQLILDDSAAHCAKILSDHAKGQRQKLSITRQRACEYVIDHAIGKARQKIQLSGGIMTYGELAKSAESLETKPRPILADAEEIANKHTPEPIENDATKEEDSEP